MSENTKDLTPGEAIHPGELLMAELKSRGMTVKALANITRLGLDVTGNIIGGTIAISLDYAFAIGKALGQDPEIWMNAQKNYDADQAKIAKQQFVKAVLLVARALSTDPAYYQQWRKGITTAVVMSVTNNGAIHISSTMATAISKGAGEFLDNILHATLVPEGWVYRTESK